MISLYNHSTEEASVLVCGYRAIISPVSLFHDDRFGFEIRHEQFCSCVFVISDKSVYNIRMNLEIYNSHCLKNGVFCIFPRKTDTHYAISRKSA